MCKVSLKHKVTKDDNGFKVGKPFPSLSPSSKVMNNTNLYIMQKELYLSSLCGVANIPKLWQFWMIMLKNGNFDTKSGLYPKDGKTVSPFALGRFPCLGEGCMNHTWGAPLLRCNFFHFLQDSNLQCPIKGNARVQ